MHRVTKQVAALKIINIESLEELKDFMNEINILHEAEHENVVKLFEAYLWKDTLWVRGFSQAPLCAAALIAMLQLCLEYCEGGALDAIYNGAQATVALCRIRAAPCCVRSWGSRPVRLLLPRRPAHCCCCDRYFARLNRQTRAYTPSEQSWTSRCRSRRFAL